MMLAYKVSNAEFAEIVVSIALFLLCFAVRLLLKLVINVFVHAVVLVFVQKGNHAQSHCTETDCFARTLRHSGGGWRCLELSSESQAFC